MISVDQILYDDIWYAKLIYRTWCPHFLFIALSELTYYVCLILLNVVNMLITACFDVTHIQYVTVMSNIKHT